MYKAVPMKMPKITNLGRGQRHFMDASLPSRSMSGTHTGPTERIPGRQPFRAIALDIDGTIIGPDHVVSDRLRDAIASAKRAGANVSLATGRMMRSALRFARDTGASGPAICYQGALTFMPANSEIVRHERIPPETAAAALREMTKARMQVNLYLDDEVFVEDVNDWAHGYASRMEINLKQVPSLDPYCGKGPTLLLAVGETDRTATLYRELTNSLGDSARVTHSLPHFCEVGSPRAGKEQALAHLSDLLDVRPDEFIAFGDGQGDVGMLRWAGLGVAIEGGHPDAIAAASYLAPGPQSDGVASVLESLIAEGRIGT